ncbi:hypothetical protein EVAR_81168_1 [Eumeta japonica]|uniref:Uncharacterized protein n=1 Tax=Eumeta variegata TaxID=151549 RepID=A0A4C1UK21_EUMVA|nr:hypothetical protein EVAR_81168_1 [Eumeta japonica]
MKLIVRPTYNKLNRDLLPTYKQHEKDKFKISPFVCFLGRPIDLGLDFISRRRAGHTNTADGERPPADRGFKKTLQKGTQRR